MDTFRCGDPKEGENVVINSLGYPECRICRNRRNREWAARRRAKIRAEREAARLADQAERRAASR